MKRVMKDPSGMLKFLLLNYITNIFAKFFSCTTEGRFPDSMDKKSYYLCFKNQGRFNSIHMTCPANYHFSEMDNSCIKAQDSLMDL